MAYNQPNNENKWLTNTIRTAKSAFNAVKYQLSSINYKIGVNKSLIQKLNFERKDVIKQRDDVIKSSNYQNREDAHHSRKERERIRKNFQPEIDAIDRQIQKTQRRLEQVESQRRHQEESKKPVLEKPPLVKNQVANTKQEQPSIEISEPQENDQIIPTLEEKAQQHYDLETFNENINDTIEIYLTMNEESRKNFVQSYIANKNDPSLSEGLKLFHIETLRKIEDIEHRIIYTDYEKDGILLETSNDDPLIERYMNSPISEKMEFKNALQSVRSNPNQYPDKNVKEADKIIKDIDLQEARQNLQKIADFKKKQQQKIEQKKKKKR